MEYRQCIHQPQILGHQGRLAINAFVNQTHERGLAGAALANQRDLFTLFYSQRERADNPLTTERGREAR